MITSYDSIVWYPYMISSYDLFIWYFHMMSWCDIVIWSYDMMISYETIIGYHHVISSYDIIIWSHHMISSYDIIIWYHYKISSYDIFIQYRHRQIYNFSIFIFFQTFFSCTLHVTLRNCKYVSVFSNEIIFTKSNDSKIRCSRPLPIDTITNECYRLTLS